MQRLIFWIKKIINGDNAYCDKCSLNCPYFKRCRTASKDKKVSDVL